MKDAMRAYYSFVAGAFGGLNGWFIASILLRGASEPNLLRHPTVYGAILGSMIGLCVTGMDGFMSRSIKRFIRISGPGILTGGIAGAMALPAAQAAYHRLLVDNMQKVGFDLKPLLIGGSCWLLFGSLIGLAETLHKGTQQWKGLAGGAIGGLVGGSIYECLRQISSGAAEQLFLAVGLTILGAIIGGAVALIASMLRNAWIEVLDGEMTGRIFDLTKFVAGVAASRLQGTIGSDEWKCHIFLSGDPKVFPRHAQIGLVNGIPFLSVLSGKGNTLVNGNVVNACPLRDGDKLKIGATSMVYREKRDRH